MKINKKILLKIGTVPAVLLGSFCLVFGLAFADKTSPYLDFNNPKQSISYYDATPQETVWNVAGSTSDQAFTTSGDAVAIDQQTSSENKFNYGALVIDGATHQIMDKSFNQSGYQGLVDWTWNNPWNENSPSINVKDPAQSWPATTGQCKGVKPSSDNSNVFWQTYDSLIGTGGYKTLVLPGYMHQAGLSVFKEHSNNYGKAGYILLDANTPNDLNIASIVFRADEAAFMAGIATCQYLNDNFDEYKTNGGLKVGTFGGIAIPSVTIYMGGFEYGVEAWNQNIDAIAKTQGWTNPQDHKVNFINLGQPDSFFSNSFSIGDGKPLVQALLQRGADAILPVAGPQTVDAVKEIKAYKSSCIVVGVDTAQEADTSTNSQSIYTDKSGDNKIIKFSATKNIANITSKILSLACAHIKNDLSYTNIGSFGWLSIGDIQNNGIQPSEPSWDYLVEFLESVTGNKPSDDKYDWIVKKLGELKDTGGGLGYFETLSDPDHMKFRI